MEIFSYKMIFDWQDKCTKNLLDTLMAYNFNMMIAIFMNIEKVCDMEIKRWYICDDTLYVSSKLKGQWKTISNFNGFYNNIKDKILSEVKKYE